MAEMIKKRCEIIRILVSAADKIIFHENSLAKRHRRTNRTDAIFSAGNNTPLLE